VCLIGTVTVTALRALLLRVLSDCPADGDRYGQNRHWNKGAFESVRAKRVAADITVFVCILCLKIRTDAFVWSDTRAEWAAEFLFTNRFSTVFSFPAISTSSATQSSCFNARLIDTVSTDIKTQLIYRRSPKIYSVFSSADSWNRSQKTDSSGDEFCEFSHSDSLHSKYFKKRMNI